MSLMGLLATLRNLNVHLYVEADNLKCKAPPNTLTTELRQQLSERKPEIIAALTQANKTSHTTIQAVPRTESIPLSFAQQRLWFLDQLEPDSAFYNIPIALRLTGKLNAAAVAQSFTEIVRRHENLRTAFVTVDGQATQKIHSAVTVPMTRVSLTALPEQQRLATALALCQLEAEKPFVLANGQLIRVTLISLSDEDSLLLITLHHIVFDGWSSSVLTREFAALYQAFVNGEPSPLPELTIQYADFSYWQRQWLIGAVLQQQSDYWQQQLQDAPALLELPTDYVRPPVMTHNGANYSFTIPALLAEQINALSQRHQATLFMTLLAGYMVLLARYSQQTDVCVGTPFANRNRLELEQLIGFFVNTLVIRANLSTAPTFDVLLKQLRDTVLAAKQHQDLPFEHLVEILQPERNRSYSPLFQVMFVLQNTSAQALPLPDLAVSAVHSDSAAAKFDLTLHVYPAATSSELTGIFEYNTDLFTGDTIARLAEHYLMVLQTVVAQPAVRLWDLPLLTAAEQQRMLIDWNATDNNAASLSHSASTSFPRPTSVSFPRSSVGMNPTPLQRCETQSVSVGIPTQSVGTMYQNAATIHQLFEQQAEQTPNALAVVFENQSLTYAELNANANQLARFLQSKGVVADTLVGLCVERGLAMIIGMLGILKAGGAYLSLDPTYPTARLAFMLDDTQANIVLTQEKLRELVIRMVGENRAHATVICLDTDWKDIANAHSVKYAMPTLPQHLAYIIYTSGSTGHPKGVLVTHANAVHSTTARFNTYQQPVRGYLLLSSFAFDSSVAGLFWTLSQGGYLCLPNDQQSKDPHSLAELIAKHRLSHLLALPSLYALLLTQAPQHLQSLTTAIVAGESCTTDIVKQHYALLPDVPLYNEYGPTENSVWSSVYLTHREDIKPAVSIGHPISNVKIYLLNTAYTPVPIGVTGEIYLGGAGVVRGYLNRADLTAEKFIPNPFSHTGQRLYRTGDLAKYRPDGSIEFLGRVDHQVKIRGFRIELGEIEARLLELPAVSTAVVLASNHQQLVAYIVGDVPEASLRAHLKTVLPDYMLPSAFIFLETLPLTANGKLNRNALPQPDFKSSKPVLDADKPRTATEKILAAIWTRLLDIETIGIQDDFFALGGHSLLATQLLFAVRSELNLTSSQLTLKQFFDRPTIAAQAKIITGEVDEFADTGLNLADEVQLAADILPIASELIEVVQADAIFLTGATGFLGAFLLADLLEHSTATVYCLIRAADEAQAMQRLQQQLQRYELLNRIDCSRVIAVCGDLAQPQLGLSPARYEEIAQHVSVIYHNGALVNFFQPYAMLKPANVEGSQEVLRLACTHTAKAIHYVSTLSVFSASTPHQPFGFSEHDKAELTENLDNGYAQSKWVAEQIMQLASQRGFQVSIYRPATVAGDSVNGVWNSDDFLCRLLKGCLQLGYAPDANDRIELAPVDYVSNAIVRLSQQASSIGACFHLNSPHATYTQDVLDWFNQAGYAFERVTYAQWAKKLLTHAEHIEAFALAPLLSLFPEPEQTEAAHEDVPHYDCRTTQHALAAIGMNCPTVNDALLTRYLDYFIRCGFFTTLMCKK